MVLISFCGSTYRSLKLSPKVHQHTPQIRRPSRGCEGVHTRQGFEMPCESLSSVNSLSLSFPSSTVSLCFFSFVGHRRVFSADFHYVSPVTSYVDPRPRGGVQQIQALMAVARDYCMCHQFQLPQNRPQEPVFLFVNSSRRYRLGVLARSPIGRP